MKTLLIVLCLFLLLLSALLLWMSAGLQRPKSMTITPQIIHIDHENRPQAHAPPPKVRLLSWNIAWGQGAGSEGNPALQQRSHSDNRNAIVSMGHQLRQLRVDIAVLQEVDFDSARSGSVDQAAIIGDIAGLKYIAPVISWKANYLPFPYWPPSKQWGFIRSGGAILSRWPLSHCTAELFKKPSSNSFFYNLGYLFRYVQICQVNMNGHVFEIANTHLEAFDAKNRNQQAQQIAEMLHHTDKHPNMILGGDFNTVAASAPTRHAFIDEPNQDHRQDQVLPTLLRDKNFAEVFSTLPATNRHSKAPLTFPARAPTRRLDYIIVNKQHWKVLDARVVHEANTLSDHLPIWTEIEPLKSLDLTKTP